jgi:hypothetical protein
MALDEYNRKRDFAATPEPGGESGTGKRSKTHALQYCIQKHDATRLHYDVRLELDGTLKSGLSQVLFITGFAECAMKESVQTADMHLLTKPFSMDAMIMKLRELMSDPR